MKLYTETEIRKTFEFLHSEYKIDNPEFNPDSILEKMNFVTLPSKDDIISKINKDSRFHRTNSSFMNSVYDGAEWLREFIIMKLR